MSSSELIAQQFIDGGVIPSVLGAEAPGNHAAKHLPTGSDPIPYANTVSGGLMTAAAVNQLADNTIQIALKANKSYVDTITASISSGSPKGTYATLSALQAAHPTGNTNTYVVIADGKWYYWSGSAWTAGAVYQSTGLADGSVIPPTIYKSDYYVNLFNQSTITPGYYLDNSGVQQALSSFCISDYIPVVAGQSYTVYAVDEGGNSPTFAGSYYNSSHAFLTPFTPGASPRTVTVPAGAAYVRINMGLSMIGSTYLKNTIPDRYFIDWLKIKTTNLENESVTLDKLSAAVKAEFGLSASQWAGKTANFLGDSITYGYGLADRVNDCFATLVKNSLSLATANNYGLIGTKIGKVVTGDGSFVERYSAMDAAADITFVIGGTNDYGHNASNHPYSLPFGTFTDRVETTFFGALHVLCNGLITKYPGKPIVFVTPTHRLSWDSVGDDYENNPDTGKNLRDYVNAIREVTEYYGVYVLDLFKSLNISPNVAVNKTSYMPDGLHPNEAGHVKMADAITHFTLNL